MYKGYTLILSKKKQTIQKAGNFQEKSNDLPTPTELEAPHPGNNGIMCIP